MEPYFFELACDFPEVFGSVQLPTGRISVSVNGEFCCDTIIYEDGGLDVMLPDGVFDKIKRGEATIVFPTVEAVSENRPGRTEQLISIEVVPVA
jgi:hypothetical protein